MIVGGAVSRYAERFLPREEGERVAARLPCQKEALADLEHRFLGVVGGLGSGKSRCAFYKALQLGCLNPGLPGLFVEPTYALIEDVAIRGFLELFDEWGMEDGFDYELHRRPHPRFVVRLNDCEFEILFRSSENPRSLVGFNVAWTVVDEAADHTESAALQACARARHPKAKQVQIVFVGTPEVLGGYFYDWFEGVPRKGSRLIRARTTDNHLLPEDYIELNLGHLSERDRKRYIDGEFVVPGGRVYTCYDPAIHEIPCEQPGVGRQVMACDFGFGCMAWLMGRVTGETVHYHSEQVLEGVGMQAALDRALAWWQSFFLRERGQQLSQREAAGLVDVYADPSGTDRYRNTYVTMLEEAGFTVHHRPHHPDIWDRVNSVEVKLHKKELFIDPDGCPIACRNMQQQIIDPNKGKPKKARPREGIKGHDHTNDGIGYHVEFEWRAAQLRGNSYTY